MRRPSWQYAEAFTSQRALRDILMSRDRNGRETISVSQFRNEKAAQRVSFGAGYPADVHADIVAADVRGQKLLSGPQIPGKTSMSVRTSMTRRRGRPWEQGGSESFGQETSGWIFVPYQLSRNYRVGKFERKKALSCGRGSLGGILGDNLGEGKSEELQKLQPLLVTEKVQ